MSFSFGNLLQNIDWGGILKVAAPLAVNYFAGQAQAKEAEKVAKAQQTSYDSWMQTLNPPKPVLDQRYAAATEATNKAQVANLRGMQDILAARGERGKGPVADIAKATALTGDLYNKNYHDVYSKYNVPNQPGPTNYAPGAGNLAMINGANVMNYALPQWWLGQEPNQRTA